MLKKLFKDIAYPIIKSPPDFLIIGAQKAGTTSLYNYLVQHPQIMQNKSWKEIRYFDLPENYNQGFSWYLGNFPGKLQKGNKLTLDASPSYLYFQHIPQLIEKDLGNIKMIAILRNPVKRAYSAWKMYNSFATNPDVSENNKKIADTRTFSEAINQELTNQCHPEIYPYDYVNRGKYVEQLENYYKYFDKDNILVLNFETFTKNLESTLSEVINFLNLDPFSQELLSSLQKEKYNVGKKKETNLVDQETIDKLHNYFQPFNQKLYELLGCSYSW